jgi:hypothetical protein
MKNINEFLEQNKNLGSILFYPGAGSDFETIKLFIDRTTIDKIFYIDYNHKININTLMQELGESWALVKEEKISPQFFEQTKWSDYWYNLESAVQFGSPESAYGIKLKIKNTQDKECDVYYLGTEAIKTYYILLQKKYKPDVIVLQDHGFGGNWGNQIFGYSEETNAKFYGISKISSSLPEYIFVGENTIPWPEYKPVTLFEGKYGSAGHQRAFFVKEL